MNPENRNPRSPFLIFIGAALLGFATVFVHLEGWADAPGARPLGRELGEGLGVTVLTLLVFVYARTAFKLLVRKDSFWKRLEPFNVDYGMIKTVSGKILFYLNKSHPYFGLAAIAAGFAHCLVISRFDTPRLLHIVLALLAWQGIWGLVLKTQIAPAFIKRRGHLFHSQLVTGALILFFASLGHLLLPE